MNDTRRAVAIARVSTKEQGDHGYSLSAQSKLLADYASAHRLALKQTFHITETASKPAQRRVFREMMAFTQQHTIQVIVVEKVDRLTRSLRDLVMIDDWLMADPARQIHFVKDSLVLHSQSRSQDKLNWGIRVVLAKNYIDNLKEEIQKGIREKLAQGGLPGRHPIGYRVDRSSRTKALIIDPVMGPLVQRMFTLYLQPDMSVRRLTAELNRLGLRTYAGRPVVPDRIWKMLSNQFYLGKIPWKGWLYDGQHEPLVSQVTFDAVQEKLAGRWAPRYNRHLSLFRGLIRCGECHSLITWQLQKGRYYGKCGGYRPCSRRRYYREDQAEAEVRACFALLRGAWPEVTNWVAQHIRSSYQEQAAGLTAHRERLIGRQQDLERRLALAYEDRLDGRITSERYDELAKSYALEQDRIDEELTGEPRKQLRERAEYEAVMLELCQKASTIYDWATTDQRRQLMALIFSNLTLEREYLAWDWDPTAEVIAKIAAEDREQHGTFEPSSPGSRKQKEDLLRSSYNFWCTRKDVLRTGSSVMSRGSADAKRLLRLLDDLL